jgi:2-Cys peroxiredoxin 5
MAKIQVGDKLPGVTVFIGLPPTPVNIADRFGKGRVLIFGVPGAFTPGCSKTHLPGYVRDAGKIKEKGIQEIACISKNDSFVMEAWGQQLDPTKQIVLVADPQGDFTSNTQLSVDLPVLGGSRSSRFAMVVNNGVVEKLFEEPDGKGLTCSLSDSLLSKM